MILPEVATPKGRSPEGVATAGKITHMTEGLIRASCPMQMCRIAVQTRPTYMEMFKEKKSLGKMPQCHPSHIVCNVHHKQLFVWSGLSTFEMKVFKYSEAD